MNISSTSRVLRAVPALAWMAVIFYLSSQSQVPNPTSISGGLVAIAGHLISFGILLLLAWYAFGSVRWPLEQRLAMATVLTVGYGITDEFHQSFVPGRTATAIDVLTDATGALIVAGMIIAGCHYLGHSVQP